MKLVKTIGLTFGKRSNDLTWRDFDPARAESGTRYVGRKSECLAEAYPQAVEADVPRGRHDLAVRQLAGLGGAGLHHADLRPRDLPRRHQHARRAAGRHGHGAALRLRAASGAQPHDAACGAAHRRGGGAFAFRQSPGHAAGDAGSAHGGLLECALQRRRRGAQHALGALGHPGHRPAVRRSLPRPHRRHRGAGGLRHRPRPAGVRDRRLALGPGRQPGQQRGARIGLWPRHLDGRDHLRPLDGQGAGAGGRSQAAVGGETGRNHRTLHPARRAGRQVHQPGRRPGHLHLHRHGFGRRAGHHGPAPDHRIVDCRQHAEQPGAGALQPAGGLVAGLRFLPPGREAAGRGLRHAPGAPARSASRTTGRTASSGSRTSSSPMARKAAWSSTACAWRSSPAA